MMDSIKAMKNETKKEAELLQIIKAQKDEYERMLKDRDEEVTGFVDILVAENQQLKKQLIAYEIELEYYKESIKEGKIGEYNLGSSYKINDDEGVNVIDKQFYENLKSIKESNDVKQKEILDKYDKILRNLSKENRNQISNLKKLTFDNKSKILNGEEEEEFLSIGQVEEQFALYENRIRLLYEELRNKEKYILVVEQKYDMINEETKCLKKKISEEKNYFIKQIEEIKQEKDKSHSELINQIRKEILEKKNNLQNQIDDSLLKSGEFINSLAEEKNALRRIIDEKNETIIILEKKNKQLEILREELEALIEDRDNRMRKYEDEVLDSRKDTKRLNVEIDILKKTIDDMNIKFNDINIKNMRLEQSNKDLTEISFDNKKGEYENRFKIIIDKLTNENVELEKKIRSIVSNNESDSLRLKNVLTLNEKLNLEIENLRQDINDMGVNNRILNKNLNDSNEKLEKLNSHINEERLKVTKKDEQLKEVLEKLIMKETEVKSIRTELDRQVQLKEKINNQTDELNRNNTLLSNQIENLKMNSNLEVNRLKSQINELEKLTENVHKVNIIESTKNEFEKDLKNLKTSINKFNRNFYDKFNLDISNLYNEEEILKQIEKDLNKLQIKDEKNTISIEVSRKYENEIKELKKKLSLAIQGINDDNQLFKNVEKDKNGKISLYESLIIHLKNINLKHLLEIYYLNLQREEEIKSILEKKGVNFDYNLKKNLTELNSNFISFKKLCEKNFNEYEQRSKLYILPEELVSKLEEYKTFTQWILDTLLNSLMNYKNENKDFIIFKLPIIQYNEMLENISIHLDEFNKKFNIYLEGYNKISNNVVTAIDILNKQAVIDLDSVNSLMASVKII